MSSLRKQTSARANGALSHGPKTPEGKARFAMTALRHGLLARNVVVGAESEEHFKLLLDEHLHRFRDLDGVEFGMIEELATCYWRLRRCWAVEKSWMDQAMAANPKTDNMKQIANAFATLAGSERFKVLQRYQSRMHRMYQKSLHTLLELKRINSGQTNPIESRKPNRPSRMPALPFLPNLPPRRRTPRARSCPRAS